MHKSRIVFLFLLAIAFCGFPTVQGQFWMQKGGGLTVDEAWDISIDNNGNTYTTGYFTGSATFGTTTLTSAGGTDIFITKTDNQGAFLWAKSAGGSGSDRGLSIKIDVQGNSYITGFFNSTATFGSQSVTSAGLQDVFIAKYNTSGVLQYVSSAGGTGADIGNGICVDNNGNAIVTGEFKGTATFGATSLTSANNSTDVFISKLDGTGGFTWTEHGTGNFTNRGIDVSCDGSGNIYAIGQFSDTITFGVAHNNTMFNVIFVIKYDGSGNEQWFKIIGAGNSNIANSIATDGNGNSYIVGDFTGTVTFFGGANPTQNATYANRIFLAKYDSGGLVEWTSAFSSDNDLTARSVAIDPSGNSYVIGHFSCVLNEFQDAYGEANFNSVGFNDIYVTKFNGNGVWQYARNLGGHTDDFGHGIAVNSSEEIHFAGSFKGRLSFPTSPNFVNANLWDDVSCAGNSPYCSDPDYGTYTKFDADGNSDVVIANGIDPGREPYDFYMRSGSGCDRSILSVCIGSGCPDSVTSCTGVSVTAFSMTCPNIGPDYTFPGAYQWNASFNLNTATLSSGGTYFVTQTTSDGCFSSTDTIEFVNLPEPATPNISDNKGINTNASNPQHIQLCDPDSVMLTAGNVDTANLAYVWHGPGLGSGLVALSFTTNQSGIYQFTVTDSLGCTSNVSVQVSIDPAIGPWALDYIAPDTIQVCDGENFQVFLYDTISNPNATQWCLNQGQTWFVVTTWTLSPFFSSTHSCHSLLDVFPTNTGLISIDAEVVRLNFCDTDTTYISMQVYVEVLPAPTITPYFISITGSNYYCPGDSAVLNVSGGPNYTWNTPMANYDPFIDSTFAGVDGWYNVSSMVFDTNMFGCTAQYFTQAQIYVQEKPQAVVMATSELICPNDSVLLWVTNTGASTGFNWEGPSGPIPSVGSSIYASEPGFYFCVVDDADSCGLVSNSIELNQYTTPSINLNGDLFLCEGDSVMVSVVANSGSVIEWQAPLSGSDQQQTIYAPGIYVCKITACNIETFAEIEILASYVEAEITPGGVLCEGESVVLYGSPGMETYEWFPNMETSDSIVIFGDGAFSLVTTDSNGCTAFSDTVMIDVISVPTQIDLLGSNVLCEGDSMVLFGNSNRNGYSWTPTGDTTQDITIYVAGTYTLTTKDSNGCFGSSSPINIVTPSTFAPAGMIGANHFCEGDSATIFSTGNSRTIASYLWTPSNQTGDSLHVFTSGNFFLTTIDTSGCVAISDTFDILMEPNLLNPPFARDTTICGGIPLTLRSATSLGEILWYENPEDAPIFSGPIYTTPTLEESITYTLFSNLSVCTSDPSFMNIKVLDCKSILVPNVFSPNGDGINDLFLVDIEAITCFNCKIFNRWGNQVFEILNQYQGWDGTINGTGLPANEGTYFYVLDYCLFDGTQRKVNGSLSLIRKAVK